ncbi:MAG: Intein-containing protein [Parcubacteria group bacterium GW2011_GWF2_38_76]|nr:MAG: Intein-containing protein [Parcubacteria group bacterium GW2011_GWF2_38_76]
MPGLKPFKKVVCEWSPNFAYVIGLLASDGCLGRDGSHIDFTSKDLEQINNFKKCLRIDNKIGKKVSGEGHLSFRIQFRDANFHQFLVNIGITPFKSKTMEAVEVPEKYFFDFVRGLYDGDGSSYSYFDPRWKSSFMFYTIFSSASKNHIDWLRNKICRMTEINGHITKDGKHSVYQLKYAKAESVILLKKLYYSNKVICLSRKRLKNEKILGMIGEKL